MTSKLAGHALKMAILVFIVAALAACGRNKGLKCAKPKAYQRSPEVGALVIPGDLTTPLGEERFDIPDISQKTWETGVISDCLARPPQVLSAETLAKVEEKDSTKEAVKEAKRKARERAKEAKRRRKEAKRGNEADPAEEKEPGSPL
ncbi:MAG: hypothetical protein MJA83_07125 [Gammaproteobacteria bacterium]|nr:hypothetical protein [Gammaproteobacteria bacterium]